MIDLILGPLGAVLAGILGLVVAWAKGRRDGRQEAEKRALDAYQKTRKAVDDAARDLPDDDGVLRDLLRERGRQP